MTPSVATILLLSLAHATLSADVGQPISVPEIIAGQEQFAGRRVTVTGVLSDCQPLSCGLSGRDRNGHRRYLSIARDAPFDASVRRLSGHEVEVEVTVTKWCMPDVDPDIIVMCTDRPATLTDPILIRAR